MKIRPDVLAMLGESDPRIPVLSEAEIEDMQRSRQGQAALAVFSARRGQIKLRYAKALEIIGCPPKFVMDIVQGVVAVASRNYGHDGMASGKKLAHDLAPEYCIGTLMAIAQKVARTQSDRRDRAGENGEAGLKTVRDLITRRRERAALKLFREHGPIPAKQGAGELYEDVKLIKGLNEPGCSHSTSAGDRNSVARSYGYGVTDHHVDWQLPATYRPYNVGGTVCLLRYPAQPEDSQERDVDCWAAKRGKGYSGYWIHCFIRNGELRRSTHAGFSHKV